MTDNLTRALAVGQEAEMRQRKEMAVADMLKRFVPGKYYLLHSKPENGLNTFSLGPAPDEDARLQIVFCGPHAFDIRKIVRDRLGKCHRFRYTKAKGLGLAASMSLDHIAPVSADRLISHVQKAPEKVMRVVPVTLAERIHKTPGYPQAISFLDELHRFELIVGCPSKQKFRETESGAIIEYVYINEDEAFEAMRLCDECFQKSSFATPSNASGVMTVSFLLEGVKQALVVGRSRKLRQLKKRVLPYTDRLGTVLFVTKRLLAFERVDYNVSRSGGFVTLRLRNDKERNMTKIRLEAFDFVVLSSEIDPRCMWIALAEHVARVFETSRLLPSDTIKRLEKGQEIDSTAQSTGFEYNTDEGMSLLKRILDRGFGWRASQDYTLNPRTDEGRLLYVSISTVNDDDREKRLRLKDEYRSVSDQLPRGVQALFAAPFTNTAKALYVYFVDRADVAKRFSDGRGRKPKKLVTSPPEVTEDTAVLTDLEVLLAGMDKKTLRKVRRLVKNKLQGE